MWHIQHICTGVTWSTNSSMHVYGMSNTQCNTFAWHDQHTQLHLRDMTYTYSSVHVCDITNTYSSMHVWYKNSAHITTVTWLALTVHEIILLEGWHHKHFTQISSIYDLLRFFKIKIIFNDRCFIKEQFINWFLNKSVLSFNIKHIGSIYLIIQTGKII